MQDDDQIVINHSRMHHQASFSNYLDIEHAHSEPTKYVMHHPQEDHQMFIENPHHHIPSHHPFH
jgi:hypothetical protein